MSKTKDPLALDPGSPEAPSIFGKYLLFGLVARGGMAEVYKAKRIKEPNGGLVALKCMRKKLSSEKKYIDMFLAEGQLGRMLQHENIVKTLEGGRYKDTYYFIMEYIAGKDLTHILRKMHVNKTRLPIPAAIYITMKAARGLDYAHNLTDEDGNLLKLVNRDVSPSNIRISFDGEVKLLDFGIAKAKNRYTSEIGTLKGKFSYMSPEQIRGLPLDGRTDIFSLGIILYEMLTLERLFKADSETALMEKVRKSDIPPPSTVNHRISQELDNIIMKALKRERDERYSTAAEFADDLEKILETYKFQVSELSNLMKMQFPDEYKNEISLNRLSASVSDQYEEADSGRHDSFDSIINSNISLKDAFEIEMELDDEPWGEDDEGAETAKPEIKQEVNQNQPDEVTDEQKNKKSSNSLMKYIYIMSGLTGILLFLIILIVILKK